MTYAELARTWLIPLPQAIAAPSLPATPARRLRDALEPIATQGWWSRPVGERMDALGVPAFAAYVWGRAAPLGSPDPSVVVATFGVFEAALLTDLFRQASQAVSRQDILTTRERGAAAAVDSVVNHVEAELISAPLLRAVASLDGLGRPLFSALRALSLPATAGGRLWRAAELVREHRGDGHLAALATAGVDAVEANVLTELWVGYSLGDYSATRGFSATAIWAAVERLTTRGWMGPRGLTDVGAAARLDIEAATDRSQDRLLEAVGDDLEPVIARCALVAERLLAKGWFPPDPRKRAGG